MANIKYVAISEVSLRIALRIVIFIRYFYFKLLAQYWCVSGCAQRSFRWLGAVANLKLSAVCFYLHSVSAEHERHCAKQPRQLWAGTIETAV